MELVRSETPLLTELRALIARHAEQASTLRSMPNVILATKSLPTLSSAHIAEPAFALVAQGAKRAVVGNQVYDYATGHYLIISVDLPLTAHVEQASADAPYLGFGLLLKPEAIATLLLETGVPQKSKTEPSGIAVSNLTTELLDAIVRLLRLLDQPIDVPVLAPAIEREILWRLICGDQGAMVQQIGLADSRMAQIGRAIRWISGHYAETIRIDDLADAAGMSPTSFHRHFRRVTSLSPIQFQKQIRLQEARSRLMSSSQDIASVGYSVGYESPSQFSREYRRLFGAAPGQDGERLRQSKKLHQIT